MDRFRTHDLVEDQGTLKILASQLIINYVSLINNFSVEGIHAGIHRYVGSTYISAPTILHFTTRFTMKTQLPINVPDKICKICITNNQFYSKPFWKIPLLFDRSSKAAITRQKSYPH